MAVEVFVPGHPAPKGSRSGPGGRREANRRTGPWVEAVALVARSQARHAPPMPYRVDRVYVMPRPARPSYAWPTLGDIDKLDRALFDGLVKGGLIVDDRHIVAGEQLKRYAEPGEPTGVYATISSA